MDIYNSMRLARMEHEARIRSLRPVPEYEGFVKAQQPGWISQHVGHLLSALGRKLAALGEWMKHHQAIQLEVRLAEPEQSRGTN